MTSLTLFLILIPIVTFVLLTVNLLFAPHKPYKEKNSVFECGYHSFLGQNRTQFSISFFIFALLFLLFDLEILLVYPYIVSAYSNGVYGLSLILIFFLMLTLGFAFELGKKALSIESRQISDFELIKISYASITYMQSYCHIRSNISKIFSFFWRKAIAFRKAQYIYCVPVFAITTKACVFYMLGLLKDLISDQFKQYILNITFVAEFIFFIKQIQYAFISFLCLRFLGLNTENTRMEAVKSYRLITCFFNKYSLCFILIVLVCFTCKSLIQMENVIDLMIYYLFTYIIYSILTIYLNCCCFCIYLYLTYINTNIKDHNSLFYYFIMLILVVITIINLYCFFSISKSIIDFIYGFLNMNGEDGTNQDGSSGNTGNTGPFGGNTGNSGKGPSGGNSGKGPSGGNSGGLWGGPGGHSGESTTEQGDNGNYGGNNSEQIIWFEDNGRILVINTNQEYPSEGPSWGDTENTGWGHLGQDQELEENGRVMVWDINSKEYLEMYNEFKNKRDPVIQEINRLNKRNDDNAKAREYLRIKMQTPQGREQMRQYWREYYHKRMQIPEVRERINKTHKEYLHKLMETHKGRKILQRIRERKRISDKTYRNKPEIREKNRVRCQETRRRIKKNND